MDTITKSPIEKFPVNFNFSLDLVQGETISEKVITCVNAATGVSSKSTIIDSEAISSPDVVIVVKAGTGDDEHRIQCVITTSAGAIFQRDLLLCVHSEVTDSFMKQPDDSFVFDVDFTRRLESGDTVASAVVAAVKESDGSDAAALVPGSVVSTPLVAVAVIDGVDGETYRLGIRGTTTTGYVYEKFVRMNVQEY